LFQVSDLFFSIVFFGVIFANVKSLGDWNFYQVLFLFAFSKIIITVSTIWYRRGVQTIGRDLVRMGDLDFYLAKPVNPLILVSISKPEIYEFINLFFSVPLVFYAAMKSGIAIGFTNLIWFIALFVCALLLYYFIQIITVVPAFWFIKLWSLTDILNRLSQFMRYPVNIFPLYLKFLLMVLVPILTVSYVPVATLFYPPRTLYIIFMFAITLVFGIIVSLVWKAGLKHYGSASS
jgi:ABC-2 type transport system permease protein